MTLGSSLNDAATRLGRRPGLLVVGTAVVVVQAAVVALGGVAKAFLLATTRGPEPTTQPWDPTLLTYLVPLGTAVVLAFTLPLLVAIYVPARGPPRGALATLRTGAGAVRRQYRPVLGAVLRAEGIVLLVGLAATFAWYVLATAGRAFRYVVWDAGAPYPMESLLLAGLAFGVAVALARVAFGFADLAALSGRVSSATAWRVSLGFSRRNRRVVAGYAVVAGAFGVVTLASASVVGDVAGGGVGALVGVAVASVATTFLGVFRVSVFDGHGGGRSALGRADAADVERPTRDGRVSGLATSRTVLAVLVLLAAVGGAAAVRVDETWTHDPETEHVPADASPATTYRTALENTETTNHRIVYRSYNRTEGDGRAEVVWVSRYDFTDRRAIIRFYAPASAGSADAGHGGGGYYDSGVLAVYVGEEANWTNPRGDRWTPLPFPGWGFAVNGGTHRPTGTHLPAAGVEWTVAERNESTLVLRVTGTEPLRSAAEPETYAGMGPNMSENSSLTVVVDRERLVVERAVWEVRSTDPAARFTHVVRVDEVGSHDVTRPDALPPRHPMEWFWDAIYY